MKHLFLLTNQFLLSTLSEISGTCSVYSNNLENSTRILVEFNQSRAFEIVVDYDDVDYKFECFGLKLERINNFSRNGLFRLGSIEFSNMKCCVRYEWERPAIAGELPDDWEQKVGEHGRKKDIPVSAISTCSSLVALVFYDDNEFPIFSIFHDIANTVEISVSRDSDFIQRYTDEHELMTLEDISKMK